MKNKKGQSKRKEALSSQRPSVEIPLDQYRFLLAINTLFCFCTAKELFYEIDGYLASPNRSDIYVKSLRIVYYIKKNAQIVTRYVLKAPHQQPSEIHCPPCFTQGSVNSDSRPMIENKRQAQVIFFAIQYLIKKYGCRDWESFKNFLEKQKTNDLQNISNEDWRIFWSTIEQVLKESKINDKLSLCYACKASDEISPSAASIIRELANKIILLNSSLSENGQEQKNRITIKYAKDIIQFVSSLACVVISLLLGHNTAEASSTNGMTYSLVLLLIIQLMLVSTFAYYQLADIDDRIDAIMDTESPLTYEDCIKIICYAVVAFIPLGLAIYALVNPTKYSFLLTTYGLPSLCVVVAITCIQILDKKKRTHLRVKWTKHSAPLKNSFVNKILFVVSAKRFWGCLIGLICFSMGIVTYPEVFMSDVSGGILALLCLYLVHCDKKLLVARGHTPK